MKIERIASAEAPLLAELEKVAFEHPWSLEALASELEKPATLALADREEVGGRLAAAAIFATVLDEAELLRIATRPEARRLGHARQLLRAGLDRLEAAGITRVHLEVAENNRPARKLYQSLGFAEQGRRPAYYRNGAAALLYRRDSGPQGQVAKAELSVIAAADTPSGLV